MATYIKDLIELPDQVRRGDFVLRLTEGVTKPEETLDTCPVRLRSSWPDATSHRRTVLSMLALAKVRPSGLKATELT